MKLLIILFFIISPVLVIAQSQNAYEPIDSVGWELPDFSELQGFDRSDLGSVTYLLILNKSGRIKKVKTLSSTLKEQTELKLRNELEGLTLVKKVTWNGQPGNKGRLQISMGACIDNRDNKD